jgi:hypothetical protein
VVFGYTGIVSLDINDVHTETDLVSANSAGLRLQWVTPLVLEASIATLSCSFSRETRSFFYTAQILPQRGRLFQPTALHGLWAPFQNDQFRLAPADDIDILIQITTVHVSAENAMIWFQTLVSLLCMGALFVYINERILNLETTDGVMVLALIASCLGWLLQIVGLISWHNAFTSFLARFDSSSIPLNELLCFFLFARALHNPIRTLEKDKWVILALAIVGTLTSIFIVGIFRWSLLSLVGIGLPFLYVLLFGAIISPTDPIATLAILKSSDCLRVWKRSLTENHCSTSAIV